MLASPKCSLPSNPPHLFFMKRGRKYISKFSKKEDTSENPKSQDSVFPLKVSNVFLARSAIAVLGLGFIDAGNIVFCLGCYVLAHFNKMVLQNERIIIFLKLLAPFCLV
ncbi:uncharacterized protein LOC131229341 isoform X2 [Magnolia sinica]|uniref:uncharacterized protein LOC131229341 isoform X2 n=1 Tax=Magnolia sinica TaxID=86752 RepID=UPI00265AD4D6|nr:uncharacterized protein LOC131229341 isoform X2 [Magnolia sinica]